MYHLKYYNLDKSTLEATGEMTKEEFRAFAKPATKPSSIYMQTQGEFIADGQTITFEEKADPSDGERDFVIGDPELVIGVVGGDITVPDPDSAQSP